METNIRFNTPFRPEGFDFAGQTVLRGVRCLDCGEHFFPARPTCLCCSGTRLESITLSPRGKIYSYTVIHRAPAGFQPPYSCGWVITDDGVKLWAMFRIPADKLHVGLPVKIIFDKLAERTIYYFEPAE